MIFGFVALWTIAAGEIALAANAALRPRGPFDAADCDLGVTLVLTYQKQP